MIKKDELLFTVDENNQPVAPKPRNEVHANGYWHRTAHIWIFNDKKEILCQKRSLLKDMNPGKWEPFFGGHMAPQQEYIDNALLELQEELGIKAIKKDLHFFGVHKAFSSKEFQGVFYYKWRGNIDSLTLEKEEVDKVAWFSLEKLKVTILQKEDKNWSIWGYEEKLLKEIGSF